MAEAVQAQAGRLAAAVGPAESWQGSAATAFTQTAVANGSELGDAASSLRTAAAALKSLAEGLDEAHRRVRSLAAQVRQAEEAARQAEARSQRAQGEARREADTDPMSRFSVFSPGIFAAGPAAVAATHAHQAAAVARSEADQVRARAERDSEAIVERVRAADRSTAGQLDAVAGSAPAGGAGPALSPPGAPSREGGVVGGFFNGLVAGDFDQEGYDNLGAEAARGAGQIVSGLIAVGDVRDTAGNIANGNWGGAALSAVGIIPIAGDILKGGDSAADAARVARRAEIAKRAEDLAGRNLAKLEDSIPNAHFAKRHGADTTLEQQYRRATEGVTPDGVEGPLRNASRFFSNRDQMEAVQRAQAIHRRMGWDDVSIDMKRIVGEGYLAGGGDVARTRHVRVIFRDGQPNTAYPDLEAAL